VSQGLELPGNPRATSAVAGYLYFFFYYYTLLFTAPPATVHFTFCSWTISLFITRIETAVCKHIADSIKGYEFVLEVAHYQIVLISQHGNFIILCLSALCILEF